MTIDLNKNILNYDLLELSSIVEGFDEKKFRAKQIFGWLAKGVESFDDMKNIPDSLIKKLSDEYYVGQPELVLHQESKDDGTVKCLYEFPDGKRVESVFMKYEYGNSICISSQVGCRMGCKFCASTMDGLERNLTAGEMYGEVLAMRNLTGEHINHIVVMGMGEPFDNYDQLSKFLNLIHLKDGYNLSMRNITVSTCGIIPMINKFADDFPQVNLAVSLHASNDCIRNKLMPVSKKYSYELLMNACRKYTEKTGRRITFEYSMIDGVNDSKDDAIALSNSLKGWLTHVNLIPLNKVKGKTFDTSKQKNIVIFKKILEENGIAVTIRRTLGLDIDAACGQLKQR